MDVDVVMDVYDAFRAWFWNKTFWLPENRTWADLKRSDEPGSPFYPDIYDLLVVFPIAVGLFLGPPALGTVCTHLYMVNELIERFSEELQHKNGHKATLLALKTCIHMHI